ncbi:MAG: DNA polymerase I [Oscillospiraceae bacterium]
MKLLALDSNSILNRAFYGIKLLSTKNGEYTNAIYGYLNILLSLINEVQPDAIACTFDLRAPTFRHKMFEGYKGQRKGMPEELVSQMPIIKEILKGMGYKILEVEGYEADDILGTLAKICCETGNECVIATGDRDSLQLVNDCVKVRLATTKAGKAESIMYDSAAVFEKYGVLPKELIEVKALMGDTSDNIPGVAGIGEKTAIGLISKYHSLDSVYENIDDDSIKKGVREKLVNDKDNAYLSRKLGEIYCEVPLELTIDSLIPEECDKQSVYAILSRLEMSGMIKKLSLDNIVPTTVPQNEVCEKISIEYIKIDDINKLDFPQNNDLFLNIKFDDINAIIEATILSENSCYDINMENVDEISLIKKLSLVSKNTICHSAKPIYRIALKNKIPFEVFKFDTEIAAYILDASAKGYSTDCLFEEYNCRDEITIDSSIALGLVKLRSLYTKMYKLLESQQELQLLNEIEMPLTYVLASMESYGFEIDKDGLQQFGEEIELTIDSLVKDIYETAGVEFNINSPKQMAEVLFEKLQLPTKKKTKSGYSTSADILEDLVDKHPIVSMILEYRKLAKIKSTYIDGFLKLIDETGHIHTSFQQTETRTGRISSTEPNMQNIPVRTKLGANLRKYFKAGEGMVLVDADYSQIELRILAHMANDENMREAFINGEDIHLNTAAQVFDLPPLFVTDVMRSRAKAVNFGIVYGIGAFSLSKDIGVTVSEADKYIKNYLHTYSGVKDFMSSTIEFGKENGYVATLYGRRRYIPELKASNKFTKAFGERVAMNMPIQGTAADIIKLAMVKVFKSLENANLDAKLILQIHDELIVECPIENAEKVKAILKAEMESAVSLSIPIIADANIGKTWYEAK